MLHSQNLRAVGSAGKESFKKLQNSVCEWTYRSRSSIDFGFRPARDKNHELTVIPWEQENKTTLKKIMKDIDKNISRIAVFIGPEGGFSIDEIERAKAAGAVSISLGSRILRTETAAVVTCGIIMYELGDMGG